MIISVLLLGCVTVQANQHPFDKLGGSGCFCFDGFKEEAAPDEVGEEDPTREDDDCLIDDLDLDDLLDEEDKEVGTDEKTAPTSEENAELAE